MSRIYAPICRPQPNPAPARGFTLTEVLIALAILAIGLVAVASLFPSGLLLQREAVRATIRQSHIRSIDALLTGANLDNGVLLRYTELIDSTDAAADPKARDHRPAGMSDPVFDVYAVAEIDTTTATDSIGAVDPASGDVTDMKRATAATAPDPADSAEDEYDNEESYLANFPLSLRSLPTSTPPASSGALNAFAPDPDYSTREVFWVPLIRRGLEANDLFADWNAYVFVLQPPADLSAGGVYAWGNYPGFMTGEVAGNPFDPNYFPKVFRLPVTNVPNDQSEARFAGNVEGRIQVGDPVLGDNGTLYTISRVEGQNVGLNPDRDYLPLNQRELRALWVAPSPAVGQDSPVAEVRLLSNNVVRLND